MQKENVEEFITSVTTDLVGTGQSVQRLARGWAVWGSNSGRGEIFHTHPDTPWIPVASCTMGIGSPCWE